MPTTSSEKQRQSQTKSTVLKRNRKGGDGQTVRNVNAVDVNGLDKKDMEFLLNAVLVREGIRNACLVQNIDYGENLKKGPRTRNILKIIKSVFPELVFSEKYEIYQGIIVSTRSYDGEHIDLSRMGEILGYPCYKEFDTIPSDDDNYVIYVMAEGNNGFIYPLFANVCKDLRHKVMFEDIAKRADVVFKDPKYKRIFKDTIKRVYVTIEKAVSVQSVIQKLVEEKDLNSDDKDTIYQVLSNLDWEDHQADRFERYFEFNNPIHKGILLMLLLEDKHNVLSPFMPYQDYPDEYELLKQISKKKAEAFVEIVTATRSKKKFGFW
jgi:hypothetical protein